MNLATDTHGHTQNFDVLTLFVTRNLSCLCLSVWVCG
jgi:hypothetical protein